MATIEVRGPAPYSVHIGHNLTADICDFVKARGAQAIGIVHQPPLAALARQLGAELQARGLRPVLLPVPDAEDAKTLSTLGALWDDLGAANFSRKDLIIGLGGGATTDLAGFLAATWMRGITVVQVPTTLLAMVDAAVGGKTGINTAAGKNLVGAFHEPAAVFIDLDRLATLPEEEIIAGSAEIIKTGFIYDPVIIEHYRTDPAACLDPHGLLPELIERSVAVKAAVVSEDLKEAGLREILNYGHTFAHAIELHENYRWRHGDAVAVGMVFEAELAYQLGYIDDELRQLHRSIMQSVGLPTTYSSGEFESLLAGMGRDKKNKDGAIRFIALTAVGKTTAITGPEEAQLRRAYAAIAADAPKQEV